MLAVGCAVILDAHRGPTAGATELLCCGCSVPRLPEPSQANPAARCVTLRLVASPRTKSEREQFRNSWVRVSWRRERERETNSLS